jgi:glycosyltransferase involved in cell wall biosynthesis
VLDKIAQTSEIIFVVDGSPDDSWEVVSDLSRRHARVRGVSMMRNYGQHNALLCGIRAARHPVCITMDDDLQHAPEDIPVLLATLNEGFEVVYGAPVAERHGFMRDVASRITKVVLASAMGADTARNISAFRVFHTRLRQAFEAVQGPYVNIDVLLTWGAVKFGVARVPHHERAEGASNYTIGKLIVHAFNMVTGFSTVPLRVASYVGFGFTVFGLLVLSVVLANWFLRGSEVPGFAFLASVVVVLGGAQMFVLGVMGEYLARMHFRVMDKPPYVVATREGFDDE